MIIISSDADDVSTSKQYVDDHPQSGNPAIIIIQTNIYQLEEVIWLSHTSHTYLLFANDHVYVIYIHARM